MALRLCTRRLGIATRTWRNCYWPTRPTSMPRPRTATRLYTMRWWRPTRTWRNCYWPTRPSTRFLKWPPLATWKGSRLCSKPIPIWFSAKTNTTGRHCIWQRVVASRTSWSCCWPTRLSTQFLTWPPLATWKGPRLCSKPILIWFLAKTKTAGRLCALRWRRDTQIWLDCCWPTKPMSIPRPRTATRLCTTQCQTRSWWNCCWPTGRMPILTKTAGRLCMWQRVVAARTSWSCCWPTKPMSM